MDLCRYVTLDLACCCPRMPFDGYYQLEDAEVYERGLDLEVGLRTINHGLIVWSLSREYYALSLARLLVFYASISVF